MPTQRCNRCPSCRRQQGHSDYDSIAYYARMTTTLTLTLNVTLTLTLNVTLTVTLTLALTHPPQP